MACKHHRHWQTSVLKSIAMFVLFLIRKVEITKVKRRLFKYNCPSIWQNIIQSLKWHSSTIFKGNILTLNYWNRKIVFKCDAEIVKYIQRWEKSEEICGIISSQLEVFLLTDLFSLLLLLVFLKISTQIIFHKRCN